MNEFWLSEWEAVAESQSHVAEPVQDQQSAVSAVSRDRKRQDKVEINWAQSL